MIAFCPEHPKWDQNPKLTPLSETTSIPTPFTQCGVPSSGSMLISRATKAAPEKWGYKDWKTEGELVQAGELLQLRQTPTNDTI